MKMFEILELSNLYGSISNTKMPLKTTYKFARLMKRAEEELVFYQEKFQEIVNEYGQRDEDGQFVMSSDGNSVIIIPGKEKECNSKILELRELEVSIDGITFSIEELDALNVTIAELSCLMSLIED